MFYRPGHIEKGRFFCVKEGLGLVGGIIVRDMMECVGFEGQSWEWQGRAGQGISSALHVYKHNQRTELLTLLLIGDGLRNMGCEGGRVNSLLGLESCFPSPYLPCPSPFLLLCPIDADVPLTLL